MSSTHYVFEHTKINVNFNQTLRYFNDSNFLINFEEKYPHNYIKYYEIVAVLHITELIMA